MDSEWDQHDGDEWTSDASFDAEDADVRYGLTALGEAVLACAEDRERPDRARFRGFGPCVAVA